MVNIDQNRGEHIGDGLQLRLLNHSQSALTRSLVQVVTQNLNPGGTNLDGTAAGVQAAFIAPTDPETVPNPVGDFRLQAASSAIQFSAIVSLTLAVTFFDVSLWTFTALLAFVIGPSGMNNPSVQGLYLFHFDKSGSATSLMSVSVFMFGSLLGLSSGLFYDGTLRPIVYTMLAGQVVVKQSRRQP